MDVLRKELNAVYAAQQLDKEHLDASAVALCKQNAAHIAVATQGCTVLTDAAADRAWISMGKVAELLGLPAGTMQPVASSDEDIIYRRIHPEDLVDKRMLEYRFFRHIDTMPAACKLEWKAACSLRMLDSKGQYLRFDNTTQILQLSPRGTFWLILCTYELSPWQHEINGIAPCIINNGTGEIHHLTISQNREHILSDREKDILHLIRNGLLSKEIADRLHISVHTVNRHRQNILQKLSVSNSMEAVRAATAMRLI